MLTYRSEEEKRPHHWGKLKEVKKAPSAEGIRALAVTRHFEEGVDDEGGGGKIIHAPTIWGGGGNMERLSQMDIWDA